MKYRTEYLKAGGTFCPFCTRGDGIEGGSVEVVAGRAFQPVYCSHCSGAWHDEYDLVNAKTVEEPDEERRYHAEKRDSDPAPAPADSRP